MKVDLHLHSKLSEKNHDFINWLGDYEFFHTLIKHKVKIAALSDHNVFSFNYYKKMKQIAYEAEILFLPAIEINVVTKRGVIGNIVFVFTDKLLDSELQKIEKICHTKLLKDGISLKSANIIFNDFNHLKIPHVGKSDYLEYEDLLEIDYDAFEITNKNNHNYKKVLKKGLNSSIVAFSDTHIWKKYPQHAKNLLTFIEMETISFDELKKALKKNLDYTYKI